MSHTNTPYDAQLAAYQAEQQRQRDIALKQLQDQTDIHTHAQKDINQQGYDANMAKQSAAADQAMKALKAQFEGQGALQGEGYSWKQRLQEEQEKAQFGLQGSAQDAAKERQREQEAAARQMLAMQAQFQKEAEERRNAAVTGLLNNFNSTYGGSINGAIGGGTPGGGPAAASGEDAARSAAFAAAKDQAGQIGRSSMTALQNQMGGRGLTGSGLALNQAGGVIGEGAKQLGDVNRQQLTDTTENARRRASEQYQGAITMRGQNIGAISALTNLYGGARAY